MNFERAEWRPVFLREPVSQRAWNLVTRGARAYLLRVAEDDGTLLKRCTNPYELLATLGAHAEEAELVRSAIDTLLQDGFLRWDGDANHPAWLGVDRLVTFGAPHAVVVDAAEEPPADRRKRLARERQTRARERSRGTGERDMSRVTSVTGSVTSSVTEGVTGSVTERDMSRLPPQSPPSEQIEKYEIKSGSGSRADSVTPSVTERDGERDSERDGERDESRVTAERDPRDRPRGVEAPKPLRSAGRGVRWPDDPGTRGHERVEPQLEHRRYARLHQLDLDECMRRFREDPRTARLSTTEAWNAITRMLENAVAARSGRLAAGGLGMKDASP